MAIKVQFEIGHTSKLRSKKTHEGFTHDWELYVQGVDQSEIRTFVDKVVFNLHDSFPKPKRACKDPPYVIQESGYAGFMLPIDIYFRNRDEPKRVQFTYDLDLQQTGPPHQRYEIRKFIFENPSEEFRQKLLKGGGVPVAGIVSGNIQDAAITATCNTVLMGTNSNEVVAVSTENGSGMINKPKMSSSDGKKHKSRCDDYKINTFANLFGTPIHKSKNSPDTKCLGSSSKNNCELAPAKSSNSLNGNISKEKLYRDKNNSHANMPTKSREKMEKRDIQKLSPRKDVHSESKKLSIIDSGKHETRNSDKNDQKDKQRDRERGRDRKKCDTILEGSNNFKRSYSPQAFLERAQSPKRTSPQARPSSASGRIEEQKRNKTGVSNLKSNIDTISRKTKKYKRDKERDKEKREINQRKIGSGTIVEDDSRTREEPQNSELNQIKFSPNCNSREKEKEEKEKHSYSAKCKGSNDKLFQRNTVAANCTPSSVTSNSSSNDRKKEKKSSHKHKKKAKNKEQDKDSEKDKNIDKFKETKGIPLNKSDIPTKTTTNQIIKKTQNKEKTNKYKTCSKLEDKSKSKTCKSTQDVTNNLTNPTLLPTNDNSNNDLNEIGDNLRLSNKSDVQNVKTISLSQLSEESSNSSFPDMPTKKINKTLQNSPSKRPKVKQSPLATISEATKQSKELEKEDIKRRKPISKPDVLTDSPHAFVEPPTKVPKKDQTAISLNEPLKSPLSTSSTANSSSATSVNNAALQTQFGSVNLYNATGSAMVLPSEYLNELQELHQKIMTLQDNEELQQIVELIAATGCYEITAKTFDFDLCKLDRNTVQRLQEFLATSVC